MDFWPSDLVHSIWNLLWVGPLYWEFTVLNTMTDSNFPNITRSSSSSVPHFLNRISCTTGGIGQRPMAGWWLWPGMTLECRGVDWVAVCGLFLPRHSFIAWTFSHPVKHVFVDTSTRWLRWVSTDILWTIDIFSLSEKNNQTSLHISS